MIESFSQFVEQLETVLESNPGDLLQFAISLRDSGVSKAELTRVFDAVRSRHSNDQNSTKYDLILDTMDYITGWCSPQNAMYTDEST